MLVAGPQRGLFLACLLVGAGSVLALDLHFAPRALSAEGAPDAAVEEPALAPAARDDGGAPARVVIPAPARVPTIVARFESASKEPLDETAIRALATAMIEDHDVTIVLEGHSDTRGGDDFNHTISLERAAWVKSRLVALGVSAERIEAVGFGATRPLRSDDPDAPSVNRRVEVRWLGSAPREAPPAAKAGGPPREGGGPRGGGGARERDGAEGRGPRRRASPSASGSPAESAPPASAPPASAAPETTEAPADAPPGEHAPATSKPPPSEGAPPSENTPPSERAPSEHAPPVPAETHQPREEH